MAENKDLRRQRYAEDPVYREKTLAAQRRRYAENEESREATLAVMRARYAEDPQYREDAKARSGRRHQRQKADHELQFGPPLPRRKFRSDAERNLWRTYGLTQADYDFLAAAQGGLCAICERKPRRKLCADHDHSTRQLRFLLCNNCNIGFGYFGEDPDVLRRAVAYAEFWKRLRAAGAAVRLVPDPKSRKC